MTTGTDMPPALTASDGGLPGSGTLEEPMGAAGISASRIAAASRELVNDRGNGGP